MILQISPMYLYCFISRQTLNKVENGALLGLNRSPTTEPRATPRITSAGKGGRYYGAGVGSNCYI